MAIDKEELLSRFEDMKQERRQSMDARAKSVAEYIAPERGRFEDDDRRPDRMHGKRGDLIIDSTPMACLEVATNGMYSGLTPPSRPWHRTKFEDDGLNKWGPAKEFMDALEKRRNAELRRSNFYSAMHSSYGESIAFGSTLIGMEEFPEGGFRFRTFTFGEFYWARNAAGKVDTVYRTEFMTAKQMRDAFGDDKLSKQVRQALRENRLYTAYEVLHVVEPRPDRNAGKKNSQNKPFSSVWMELSNDREILRESGFDDFPYAAGVWMLVGSDNYGSGSPGLRVIPDVKMLQDMEDSCLLATHRELDPPIQAPVSHKGEPIKRNAGGITYYEGQGGEGYKRLYEFKFDLNAGELKSEAIRKRIYKGMYNDLFLAIIQESQRGTPPTATQILEMKAEQMLQLGPFIERQEDEVLDPIVVFTTLRILQRPWIYNLPPPPEEISSQPFKIEYISLLAQAQRMVGIKTIDETAQFAGGMAAVSPLVLDNYDFDEMARERADLVGLPAKCLRSEDEVMEVRKAREQDQAQMAQAQTAQAAVEGVRALGQTPMNPEDPNALTEIIRGLGGEEAVGGNA